MKINAFKDWLTTANPSNTSSNTTAATLPTSLVHVVGGDEFWALEFKQLDCCGPSMCDLQDGSGKCCDVASTTLLVWL
jgi:hypothetical protein